jgi:DNA integrity scanning protein DisA with diadenylate cyclase activity
LWYNSDIIIGVYANNARSVEGLAFIDSVTFNSFTTVNIQNMNGHAVLQKTGSDMIFVANTNAFTNNGISKIQIGSGYLTATLIGKTTSNPVVPNWLKSSSLMGVITYIGTTDSTVYFVNLCCTLVS